MTVLVLVVDDEPDIESLFRQHFRRELKSGQFAMTFAADANEALTLIEGRLDVALILILSDINMPGMSGLDMLPLAKAARPEVPIIMVTAYGDADTEKRALENGAEGLISKPIDFSSLRDEIHSRIGVAQ